MAVRTFPISGKTAIFVVVTFKYPIPDYNSEGGRLLNRNILIIGITILMFISTLSPLTIGYRDPKSNYEILNHEELIPPIDNPSDSDWPMYQHDAENTGYSSSPFPDSLTLLYNHSYEEIINSTFWSIQSSPIIANGKIFIVGNGWKFETDVIALDENDGSLIWEADLPLNYSSAPFINVNSPVVSDGKVFVCYGTMFSLPPQSRIFALDEETGEIIWEKLIFTNSAYPSVTVSNDKVIVGGHFTSIIPISRLYVFDADTGDLIWRKTMFGYFESTPVVSNNTVFTITSCVSPMTMGFNTPLFSRRARVFAFDLSDGSTKWQTRVKGHIIFSSPTVSNGKLLVPSNIMGWFIWIRRITALDVETGEEIWRYQSIEDGLNSGWPTSVSTPSVAYGKVYITDASGFIIAFNENSGDMLWKSEIIEEVEGPSFCATIPPVIADYKVIVASYESNDIITKSEICMFNVSNGEKIWNMDYGNREFLNPIPFAIANGKLFINVIETIYVYG